MSQPPPQQARYYADLEQHRLVESLSSRDVGDSAKELSKRRGQVKPKYCEAEEEDDLADDDFEELLRQQAESRAAASAVFVAALSIYS